MIVTFAFACFFPPIPRESSLIHCSMHKNKVKSHSACVNHNSHRGLIKKHTLGIIWDGSECHKDITEQYSQRNKKKYAEHSNWVGEKHENHSCKHVTEMNLDSRLSGNLCMSVCVCIYNYDQVIYRRQKYEIIKNYCLFGLLLFIYQQKKILNSSSSQWLLFMLECFVCIKAFNVHLAKE
jgi:hypothetical protein